MELPGYTNVRIHTCQHTYKNVCIHTYKLTYTQSEHWNDAMELERVTVIAQGALDPKLREFLHDNVCLIHVL